MAIGPEGPQGGGLRVKAREDEMAALAGRPLCVHVCDPVDKKRIGAGDGVLMNNGREGRRSRGDVDARNGPCVEDLCVHVCVYLSVWCRETDAQEEQTAEDGRQTAISCVVGPEGPRSCHELPTVTDRRRRGGERRRSSGQGRRSSRALLLFKEFVNVHAPICRQIHLRMRPPTEEGGGGFRTSRNRAVREGGPMWGGRRNGMGGRPYSS